MFRRRFRRFRSRRRFSRRLFRRRRTSRRFRRSFKPSRSLWNNNTGVGYLLKRTFKYSASPIIASSSDQHFAWTFKFNDLPDYAGYVDYWDEYQIYLVKIQVHFTANTTDPALVAAAPVFVSHYNVIDHNDDTALTTEDEYLQYANVHIGHMPRSFKRLLVPSAHTTVGSVANASVKFRPWITTSTVNLKHYGLKVFIPSWTHAGTFTGSPWQAEVFATYYLKFRNKH